MRRLLFAAALLAVAAGCAEESPAPVPDGAAPAQPRATAGDLLYIIDSADGGGGAYQVLLIDAQTRSVVRSFPASYTPDIALSPDGRTLFLTRRVEHLPDVTDLADAIDSATGEVLRDGLNIDGRLYYIVYPPAEDWIRVSPDGRLLYYIAYGEMKSGCGDCDSYVRAVDIATGERVQDIHLPWCAVADLEFDHDRNLLYAHCFKGQTAVVDLDTGESTPLPLYGEAFLSVVDQERGWWYVLSRDLRLFPVNLRAGRVQDYPPVPEIGLDPRRRALTPVATTQPGEYGLPGTTDGAPFPRGGMALSPDGGLLYIGVATSLHGAQSSLADQVWVFETHDWQMVRRLTLSPAAFHFALSRDGRTIYAVNAGQRTLSFIDAETGETETLTDIGTSPGKVIVSP